MLNPEQRFVVKDLSRGEIAEEIQQYYNETDELGSGPDFDGLIANDDDRLTDSVCQEYCDALAEDEENEYAHNLLLTWGATQQDEGE